ncbi:MAG: histidine kinase dimerization/phosphoacceptor domain -containing protein [Balneolaceae bacterium]
MLQSVNYIKKLIDDLEKGKSLDPDSREFLIDLLRQLPEEKSSYEELKGETQKLTERMKELRCLYSVMNLIQEGDKTPHQVFQETVQLIPPGFYRPDLTTSKLVINGKVYKSDPYNETSKMISADLISHHETIGTLSVYLMPSEENEEEVVFLAEEQELVDKIAEVLRNYIEQRQSRDKIKQSRMLLEAITEQTEAAVWIRDGEGKHILVNHEWKAIFGLEDQQVLGKSPFEILSKPLAEQFLKNDREVRQQNGPVIFDERVKTEGREQFYIVNMFPLKNVPGLDKAVGGIATEITDLKHIQQKLHQSLQEKETLLTEIHHRVKNNMAVISGLIYLQAEEENDEIVTRKLMDSVGRIKTMARIHEQLYDSNNFSELDFTKNLELLVNGIIETFQSNKQIQTDFSYDPIKLNITQALPCSLIVNEVVTNILKHAFQGNEHGKVSVEMREKMGKIILSIKDNGIGLPDDFNISKSSSLGLHLIDLLSQQLDGRYEYTNTEPGATFTLQFDLLNSKRPTK